MNPLPEIEIDWNNAEEPGVLINLYLNCTMRDFENHGLTVQEGLKIRLCGDVLEADAIVEKHTRNGHEFFVARVVEGTIEENTVPDQAPN